jgi:linoleoyl-CoA desaturase
MQKNCVGSAPVVFARNDAFREKLINLMREKIESANDHRLANWEQVFKAIVLSAMGVVCYATILSLVAPFWLKLVCFAIIGLISLLLVFNLAHDASHVAVFKTKRLNWLLNHLVFFFVGINGYLWSFRHIKAHHPYTNILGSDPDAQENSLIRFTPHQKYRAHFCYQHLYAPILYLFAISHSVFWQDYERLFERKITHLKGAVHPVSEYIIFFIGKFFYFCFWVFVPYYFGLSFGEACIGLLVAQMTTSFAFVSLLAINHFADVSEFPLPDKSGNIASTYSYHQLITNSDWGADSAFLCFWLGGANAHVAHHLFPNYSGRHAFAVTKMIRKLAAEQNLPYHNFTFIGALRSHYRFLRKMGQNPKKLGDYVYHNGNDKILA